MRIISICFRKNNVLSILMPEKSNDKGFAMTGSFTCMSLAGISIFKFRNY